MREERSSFLACVCVFCTAVLLLFLLLLLVWVVLVFFYVSPGVSSLYLYACHVPYNNSYSA
jgi:hypothetical protein